MNAELLRGWLGLDDGAWPPDPHRLLGVAPGERDLARIEHQVQERLAKLRCHQISHPDEATEGMNRLAQAFVALMDGCAKAAPPAPVTPASESAIGETPMPPTSSDTISDRRTQLDWQAAPPPVRRATPTPVIAAAPPTAVVSGNGVDKLSKEIPRAKPAPGDIANTQLIRQLAETSPEGRAGLGTLESVIRRIDDTRRLLTAWNDAGRWLRDPKRKLGKSADDQELSARLAAVHAALKNYPAILGHPGTPGYRVAGTARLSLGAFFIRGMDLPHRELLSLDWTNGRKVLLAYRRYLRQHLKKLRRRGPLALAMHAVRSFVNDHPYVVTFGLIAIAVAAAVVLFKWIW